MREDFCSVENDDRYIKLIMGIQVSNRVEISKLKDLMWQSTEGIKRKGDIGYEAERRRERDWKRTDKKWVLMIWYPSFLWKPVTPSFQEKEEKGKLTLKKRKENIYRFLMVSSLSFPKITFKIIKDTFSQMMMKRIKVYTRYTITVHYQWLAVYEMN